MPTWLKCRDCREKFYTAKSEFQLEDEGRCYKCGGLLDKICRNVEEVLEKRMLIEVLLKPGSEDRRVRAEVAKIKNDYIDLTVKDGHVSHDKLNDNELVEVRFSRKKPNPGRYYFRSKLLDYNGSDSMDISISKPKHVVQRQERNAPRFPIKTEAKHKIVEPPEELDKPLNFNRGKTLDLSVSGAMVAPENVNPEKLEEDSPVKLKLELEDQEIMIEGRIARVAEPKDIEKSRIGMGIEFTSINEEEQRALRKFQSRKLKSEQIFR